MLIKRAYSRMLMAHVNANRSIDRKEITVERAYRLLSDVVKGYNNLAEKNGSPLHVADIISGRIVLSIINKEDLFMKKIDVRASTVTKISNRYGRHLRKRR